MSSGMPVGWQRERRDSSESPRNSGAYARDSGVSGVGAGRNGRSRLRASDFASKDDMALYPGEGVGQAL